ncbi:uncharacterized protein BJX67DRAFT_186224 [Aspergillus lucknowensis]|uniref:Mid2 domain-containing protein n=1 Tax=Aspergillus lucknowensis TaxID=176173 RepID=A0ABR4LKY0_9EURO
MPSRLTTLLLTTTLSLSLLPSTAAWTFLWENPEGYKSIEPGKSEELAHPCKRINHPKGAYFEFDAEDDPVTIYLYGSTDCSGTPGGEASHWLAKDASKPIRSFEVVDDSEPESSSSTTPTLTTTTMTRSTTTKTQSPTTTTTTTETASSTPVPADSDSDSDPDSDSGSSISAGEVAGIVVGLLATAGLIGAAIFFLRRRNKRLQQQQQQQEGQGGHPYPPSSSIFHSPPPPNPPIAAHGYGYSHSHNHNNNNQPPSQYFPYSPLHDGSREPVTEVSSLGRALWDQGQKAGMFAGGGSDMTTVAGGAPPPAYTKQIRVAELAGDGSRSELSGSQAVNEMDAMGKPF